MKLEKKKNLQIHHSIRLRDNRPQVAKESKMKLQTTT